jgi:hypothetical protein
MQFLIQSDFVTQANREDIIETSSRNIELLGGIAEAFTDAVKEFCNHGTLQYVWMKYLPSDSISGDFWRKLLPKIKDCLAKTEVMRTRRDHRLQLIKNVKRVSYDFLDQNRNPLLMIYRRRFTYLTDTVPEI